MLRRRHATLFAEQNVVGAARRSGVHRLEYNPGGAQGGPQGDRHRDHAAAEAEQKNLHAAIFDDRSEALEGDGRGLCGSPRVGAVGEHQDRAVVDHSSHPKAARPVAFDDLAAGLDERSEFHWATMSRGRRP